MAELSKFVLNKKQRNVSLKEKGSSTEIVLSFHRTRLSEIFLVKNWWPAAALLPLVSIDI